MNEPTQEQIAKLPKHIREHIQSLTCQRNEATTALNEYLDTQTESPFRYWDFVSTGESVGGTCKTKFVQTNKMEVHYAGIELTILLRQGDKEIDLQWRVTDNRTGEVGMIPKSFQQVTLKTKASMR